MKTIAATLSLLLALSVRASPAPPVENRAPIEKRAQCAEWLQIADAVATRLQSNYFNAGTGNYNGGSHWTDANNIENIYNLMLATGENTWASLIDQSYLGQAVAQQKATGVSPWAGIVSGSWDDSQWMILALWKAADYKIYIGADPTPYYNSALSLYQLVEGAWDNTCGGGVWWSSADNYKNSITNELFLQVSAVGAILFPNDSFYLTNAKKAQAWIAQSALRNSQGLFNDGLVTSTCANNGQTVWIYNQAVIASGLGALYATTKNYALITEAEVTLDAAISQLTSGGILKESCDSATTQSCDSDQVAFKGIFMKHLQYFLDRVNNATITAKYAGFIHAQASGVYHYGTNSADDIGSVWYAPNAGGSIFGSTSSGSGLAAHIVNAKYGACNVNL
ncbi:Six-hairpin glycosidase [Mycena chlorophos]|uniref:Six-hairpin glycosidase n=1 Tax=Mycena chlorophos TaxID=658473 RepID=A0A8H6WA57_MYCCL|nr:Six-hairpin glycosidase [Mycena chlorophos]